MPGPDELVRGSRPYAPPETLKKMSATTGIKVTRERNLGLAPWLS